MISGCRLLVMMMVAVIVLAACQGDGVTSREQFEIEELDAERSDYCDDNDSGNEVTGTLGGQIRVFANDGSLKHTGTVSNFQFSFALTCEDNRPTSIALTVGDAGQSVKVTYSHEDASKTINFTAEEKTATLEIDPPVAHADHLMLTWFGYDDSDPWTARVVVRKREEPNGDLGDNFVVHTFALRKLKYSDGTEGHINLTLSLSAQN